MDPQQPKFFQSNFQIEHRGGSIELNGLVSMLGITKIFLPTLMSDLLKNAVGEVVRVTIDGKESEALLSQQQVEQGVFYEIKFRDMPIQLVEYIDTRSKEEGGSPGWQRKYPRISVSGNSDLSLPRPNLCMVRYSGRETFVNVMDFTLGGLRVETVTDHLPGLRAGAVLIFDLITTNGDLISNISGEVRYISIQEQQSTEGKEAGRSLGIKFQKMDPVNERKYKDLIQNYCMAVQQRLLDDK